MPSSSRAVLAALCALLLASPLAAQAATPVVLDASPAASGPAVAVDAAGTAYIAWNVAEDIGTGDGIRYCRLPRGATSCSVLQTFSPDTRQAAGPPSIFFTAGKVVIASGRFSGSDDRIWVTTAPLPGTTFDGGRVAGNIPAVRTIPGPGATGITSIAPASNALGNTRVQVGTISNVPMQTASAAFPAGGISFDTTFRTGLAFSDPATPMFSYQDDDGTWLRRFDASKSGYHNALNWLPPVKVGPERASTLAFDPNVGAYLLGKFRPNGTLDDAFQVRRISETDGSPSATADLATDIGSPNTATLTVNAQGRRTVVWENTADAPLKAAWAGPAGAFSAPGTLVPSVEAYNLAAGTADDGGGVVAWDGNQRGTISMVPIPAGGPVADPTPTPAPGPGAPAPTPAPDVSQTCKLTLAPGVIARARGGNGVSGCWENSPAGSKRYRYDGVVDVNGVIITPTGSKGTGVKVDLGKATLTAPKGVQQQKAGSVVLGAGEVDWRFSKASAGRYAQPPFSGLEKAGPGGKPIRLLGFAVIGEATLSFGGGDATITPQLSMPFPFDGLSAATSIRVTPAEGLFLDGVQFSIDSAWLGPIEVKQLRVAAINGGGDFLGTAKVVLPGSSTEVGVTVRFQDGELTQLGATATGLNVPLGPVVTLNGVGFDYVNDAAKFGVAGGVDLAMPSPQGPFWVNALPSSSGAPGGFRVEIDKAKNTATVSFDGRFQFGTGQSRFTFGTAGVRLDTGRRVLEGRVNVGLGNDTLGLRGDVLGLINYEAGAFFFEGKITACLLGCVEAVKVYAGGSKALEGGVGGCVTIPLLVTDLELAVGYKWRTGFDAGLSCDQEAYKPAVFRDPGAPEPKNPEPRPLTLGSDVIKLPAHPDPDDVAQAIAGKKAAKERANETVIWSAEIKGAPGGGAPGIRITEVPVTREEQSNGVVIVKQAPAAPTDRVIVESDPADLTAPQSARDVVLVPNPATDSVRLTFVQRGMDSLAKLPGNLPYAMRIVRTGGNTIQWSARRPVGTGGHRLQASSSIAFARNYEPTAVTGSLRGSARKRTIRWNATNLGAAGRSLQLVEADRSGTLKVIKTVTASSGSASWSIADGPGGRRIVRALVRNFDGTVVAQRDIANFIAPPTPKPTRPTRLRFKPGKRNTLAVSWAGPRNAARTLVQVQVADGRGYVVTTTKRSITIPRVSSSERVTVKVTGLSKRGIRGPSATAKRGRR